MRSIIQLIVVSERNNRENEETTKVIKQEKFPEKTWIFKFKRPTK